MMQTVRSTVGWLVMAMMAWVSPLPGMARTLAFDDADGRATWSFSNGPEFPGAVGEIAWDAARGRGGGGCLAMRYAFTGGGNYVRADHTLKDGDDPRSMRVWLKKSAGHRVTIRATDSAGQAFQKSADYAFDDWQQLAVGFSTWTFSFGGPNDGKVRFPIRQVAILVENTDAAKEGVVLIDDLEFVRERLVDAPATSVYVASDFSDGSGWWSPGGGRSRLEDAVWHYRFDDGEGEVWLGANFSLLGTPETMRLVLESDGSGHEIEVELGSHFQRFRRRIGRLTERGRQVLEVELGDLRTWQHYGGQNDGQVRLPLRMARMRLARQPDGPASGSVKLERLEITTRLEGGRPVILVPDVREEGGERVFSVRVLNLRPRPAAGALVCDYGCLDRRLERRMEKLTLPGEAGTLRREFRFPAADHHFVEARFQWIEQDGVSEPTSIGMSTLPTDPGSTQLDPASPMGVGLYLYRWRPDGRAHERMSELAGLARRAGIKWTREQFDWGAIEPKKGAYRWAFYDDLLDVAEANGLSVYALLCYWAPHAKADTPQGIDAYCRWVREVVKRYKGRIKHWEIWNEPNIFFWTGPPEMYAELLRRAYATIKEEDPSAHVLGCSTSGIDKEFIKLTMDKGGPFDALTIHPYRGVLDDMRYVRELRSARELVDGRPVWITEIGFPSQLLTGYSERRQASLAERVYLASLASGAIVSVAWYDFRNDGSDPFYNEENFGLVRSDFRPKPGYRAVATVARTLAGLKVVEQIDVGEGAYAFRFGDTTRDVIAVCAPATGKLLTFESDAVTEIINGMGEPVEPVRDGRRQIVTLDAGFPVYIRSTAGFAFTPTPPPLTLEAERTSVRPGASITVSWSKPVRIQRWELPYGWPEPTRVSPRKERLTIPARAWPGRVTLQAFVKIGRTTLRVPLVLSIQPAVIEL